MGAMAAGPEGDREQDADRVNPKTEDSGLPSSMAAATIVQKKTLPETRPQA
jgi:hypothetical protein